MTKSLQIASVLREMDASKLKLPTGGAGQSRLHPRGFPVDILTLVELEQMRHVEYCSGDDVEDLDIRCSDCSNCEENGSILHQAIDDRGAEYCEQLF